GTVLHDPRAKTCSGACRTKRSRRLKKLNKDRTRKATEAKTTPEPQRSLRQSVRAEIEDALRPVVQEELRPAVREAITQDTYDAIRDLVALTPAAVASLKADLLSDNEVIRQRASSLIMKYTVGHQAIIRPEDDPSQKQIVVNFALPRPESTPEPPPPGDNDDDEPQDLRECMVCNIHKPPAEF